MRSAFAPNAKFSTLLLKQATWTSETISLASAGVLRAFACVECAHVRGHGGDEHAGTLTQPQRSRLHQVG